MCALASGVWNALGRGMEEEELNVMVVLDIAGQEEEDEEVQTNPEEVAIPIKLDHQTLLSSLPLPLLIISCSKRTSIRSNLSFKLLLAVAVLLPSDRLSLSLESLSSDWSNN